MFPIAARRFRLAQLPVLTPPFDERLIPGKDSPDLSHAPLRWRSAPATCGAASIIGM